MKVTSILVLATFCATAASAFGLHGVANVAKAAAPRGFARNKPMVQPLDINGNPRTSFVSAYNGGRERFGSWKIECNVDNRSSAARKIVFPQQKLSLVYK